MRDLVFYHELEDMMEEQLNDCFESVSICGYNWDQGSALRQLDEIAFDQEVSQMVSQDYQEVYIDDMSEEEAAQYGISHNQVMYCHVDEVDEDE